jgi:thioredoxin 1
MRAQQVEPSHPGRYALASSRGMGGTCPHCTAGGSMLVVLLTSALLAADPVALKAFDDATFERVMVEKSPTVIIVAADWCPVCKAQEATLGKLQKDKRFSRVVVLRVDFDGQADVAKTFSAGSQSTIIAFHKGKEVGRWTGETNPERIEKMVKRALSGS